MLPSTVLRRAAVVARSGAARLTASASRRALSVAAPAAQQQQQAGRARWGWAGLLATGVAAYAVSQQSEVQSAAAGETGLSSKEFVALPLVKREKYNHNSETFTFGLKDKSAQLNLKASSYLVTRYKDEKTGKDVVRPYTPIDQNEAGVLRLLVKIYPTGNMSQHFNHLKVGDTLDIKGPLPKLEYKPNQRKHIGMVAGGTGITPMLQVVEEIVTNPSDKTQVDLVFANTTPKDILLRERLDALQKSHKNFRVTYIVDEADSKAAAKDKINVGRVDAKFLAKNLPKPDGNNTLIMVCGPPGFMNAVSGNKTPDYKQGELTGALKELGFEADNVFKC